MNRARSTSLPLGEGGFSNSPPRKGELEKTDEGQPYTVFTDMF